MIKAYKIFGVEGHRQKQSFNESMAITTFSGHKCVILNSDKTGTNDYSILVVEADTDAECEELFFGQISDGFFENSRTGKVEEIDFADIEKTYNEMV